MASGAGVRIAFPNSPAMMRAAAPSQLPASANAGTTSRFKVYHTMTAARYLWVRSLRKPDAIRNPYPMSSPNPETIPTTAARAPRKARYGPVCSVPLHTSSLRRD